MTRRDDLAALEPVIDALDALGVEHYIGGSVASSVHGVARTTLDIDIVASVDHAHVDRIVSMLEAAYYVDASQIRQAIERQRAFNLIHLDTMYKIDVFVMKDRPFDEAARLRAVRRSISDDSPRSFAIASPEDTILNKLEWYRAGDAISERQWGDLLGVIRVQRDQLDRAYLREWAVRLGLDDLLDRAWAEAEGGPGPGTSR